jgi:Tfp pilus assembly protein PilZ
MEPSKSDLDTLSLSELVGRLRDVHTLRTPLGWPTEEAVTKSHVERCIVNRVTRSEPQIVDDPSQRMTCELDVKLRSANRPSVKAGRVTLQPGGLFVETDVALEIGEPVELEVTGDGGAFRLRTRGNVGFLAHGKAGQPAGVGIGFNSVVGESAERRLERLVLELIKNRVS